MGEVGIATNVQWLIVWVISVSNITVISPFLFKLLLKTQSHTFF